MDFVSTTPPTTGSMPPEVASTRLEDGDYARALVGDRPDLIPPAVQSIRTLVAVNETNHHPRHEIHSGPIHTNMACPAP